MATVRTIARLGEAIHHHLIWLLFVVYLIASVAPAPGLWLRSVNVIDHEDGQSSFRLGLPTVLLALLLFNAGLGVEAGNFLRLFRRSRILVAGLAANLLIPLGYILAISLTLSLWHNSTEVQYILVGLALIASLPIAGSSTSWSQNADGDLALSIGLVVGSTILSPLTTPAILHAVGWVAAGTFSDCLHELAGGGTSMFLLACVLFPSLAGIAVRAAMGTTAHSRMRPGLKLFNSLNLLTLCYANAAVALPGIVSNPDWDFLAMMAVIVAGLCTVGFVAGAAIARFVRADSGQRASLMFGLGMTNNGTGLVVASAALSQWPLVLLPIIFYNLVQHFIAGLAERWLRSREPLPPVAG